MNVCVKKIRVSWFFDALYPDIYCSCVLICNPFITVCDQVTIATWKWHRAARRPRGGRNLLILQLVPNAIISQRLRVGDAISNFRVTSLVHQINEASSNTNKDYSTGLRMHHEKRLNAAIMKKRQTRI